MCENLRGSYRCVCNLGYEAVADGRECTGECAGRADGWRGCHPRCTPLTLLSGPIPALQMWTSAPSTASCVTTGGAGTARAAIAAPAPRASASGQTRRPVKVQGPGGTQTRAHISTYAHCMLWAHTCCQTHAYLHSPAQTCSKAYKYSHSQLHS